MWHNETFSSNNIGLSEAAKSYRKAEFVRSNQDSELERSRAKFASIYGTISGSLITPILNPDLVWTTNQSESRFPYVLAVSGADALTQSLHRPHSTTYEGSSGHHTIIKVFENTCKRWELTKEQQIILLGYETKDIERYEALFGSKKLSRDVEDRVGYVIGIKLGLNVIFGNNLEAEMSWLKLPRTKLNCKSPIDYMLEGSMVHLFVVSEMIKRERGI